MAYLKGTYQQCTDYNAAVTAGENYGNSTAQWAEPQQRNGEWFILMAEAGTATKDYPAPEGMEVVEELPIDPENN